MRYLFHLTTDNDFGIKINGKDFFDEVKIRATRDNIVNMIRNCNIIETNPSKTDMAEEFIDNILSRIIYDPDGFEIGGNWEVRFFPLFDDEENFDFDL